MPAFFASVWGPLILVLYWFDLRPLSRLASEGVTRKCTIVRIESRSKNSFNVLVSLPVAGDGNQTVAINADAAELARVRTDDLVQVTFLPGEVAIHRLGVVDEARVGDAWRHLGFLAGMGSISIVGIFLLAWVPARGEARILALGTEAEGEITEVVTTQGRYGETKVRFRFRDAAGVARTGQAALKSLPEPAARYAQGSRHPVLYDPDKPSRSVMVPLCRYRRLSGVTDT